MDTVVSISQQNRNTVQSPWLRPIYLVLPPGTDHGPHIHQDPKCVFNLNPYPGHICIPCLLFRCPFTYAAEWTQNLLAYAISWVTEDLQWPSVSITSRGVSVFSTLVQNPALLKKPPVIVTSFNRPEKMSKHPIWEDDSLVL